MTNSIIKTPLVIIGFGSQAKAWALNLRDSGHNVIIALRDGSPSQEIALSLDFTCLRLGQDKLPINSDILVLIPDQNHEAFFEQYEGILSGRTRVVYAHGYSLTKSKLNEKYPKFSHLLLAPKAIASEVRFQFETAGKLGALYSSEFSQNNTDEDFLKDLAIGIGITAGPFKVSFKEETYADLFSEQGLLCGLIPYAALACYKKLRERNIPKEAAYMECWLETKLICDAMVKLGPEEFFNLISPVAMIGGEKAQKQLVGEGFLKTLDGLLDDIWDKKFFNECDDTDVKKMQQEVISFWKNQELSTVHEELKKDLI